MSVLGAFFLKFVLFHSDKKEMLLKAKSTDCISWPSMAFEHLDTLV